MREARWRVVYTGPLGRGQTHVTGAWLREDAERFAAQVRRMGGRARIVRAQRGRL